MTFKSFLAAALLTVFVAGTAHADDKKLYLYTWDTYVAPKTFKKFEEATGIKIVMDIYSSNDTLMAKLKAGGAYDVIMPSGHYVPFFINEKLVQPLPKDLRKLAAGMAKTVQNPEYDAKAEYVLPMFYGTTGLAVNTKLNDQAIENWMQYFTRPDGEKPSIGVLDDVLTAMNIASIAAGKPFCEGTPATYKELQKLFLLQKPYVKVYGSTGYSERLAANEIALQMAWSGDVYKIRKQNKDIQYVYPNQGVEVWVDNMAIPVNAKNPAAAEQFIAFMMQPENAALYATEATQLPSIAAAKPLLPKEMRDAPEFNIPDNITGFVAKACPPQVVKAYAKIWSQLTR